MPDPHLPLGAAVMQAVRVNDRDRKAAWLLTLGLFPAVVVGVALTVSVYGALFGIPLLLLVGRPWWTAARALKRHQPMRAAARSHTVVAVSAFTLALAVAVLVGSDDLDSAMDGFAVIAAVTLLAVCWLGTVERLRT